MGGIITESITNNFVNEMIDMEDIVNILQRENGNTASFSRWSVRLCEATGSIVSLLAVGSIFIACPIAIPIFAISLAVGYLT